MISRVITILVLALCCGCGERKQEPAAAPPIKLGGIYWPGSYWTDVADKKGFFKEAGLNVVVTNEDADYFGAIDKVVTGELDTLTLPFFDFVRLNSEGKPITAVLVTDYSTGAEAIVAKPGIETFKDLKGKKIALDKGTYAEYIFTVVAERNDLKPEDYEIVDTQAENVADEFIKGNVDAYFAWEPLLSQGLEKVPGSKVLFSTAEIPGIAGGVQVFRKDFLATRKEDIQKLIGVWARATAYLNEHPEESYPIIAKIYDRPVEEVAEFVKTDKILGPRENDLAFSFAAGFDSIHGASRQMNDFMLDRGMTKTKLDTSSIVDPSFVRNLRE